MIAAIRAAIHKPQGYCSHLKSAFFHSTPILQRKHQSNARARSKRFGRKRAKQNFRRNVNDFAQHLFGNTSWFEKQYSRVSKRNRNGKHIPHNLDKIDEEFDIDYILRTALGGSRGFSRGRAQNFSWSNFHEEREARSDKDSNNFRRSWRSRHRLDEEEDDDYSSTESSDSESNQESHRQALGLSTSGPLNLEDVKIAYRFCALKWHPDRHHESTKNAAEEKFKLCTVAYQSLCKKLAMN